MIIFNIEFKEEKYKTRIGSHFEYEVESEGFKAIVDVFQASKQGNCFVHRHTCAKGGEKLWVYNFWNQLREAVLKFHKNKLKNVQSTIGEKESNSKCT